MTIDLVVASPVEDYFLYIDDLKNPDKEEAEKITQPYLDALGEDYSVCCQGTAFFPLQSCMNHSCSSNAKAYKIDEDRDGQATIIAVRPIRKGKEDKELRYCFIYNHYPRLQEEVGGTILSTKLAKERGWAINVGGGFHHCSAEKEGRVYILDMYNPGIYPLAILACAFAEKNFDKVTAAATSITLSTPDEVCPV